MEGYPLMPVILIEVVLTDMLVITGVTDQRALVFLRWRLVCV